MNSRSQPEIQDLFFKLSDVMTFLKRQGYPLDGTNVSYYSAIFSAFVNCNMDPVGDFVHICEKDLESIDNTPSLRLRFERGVNTLYREEEDSYSEKDAADEDVNSGSYNRILTGDDPAGANSASKSKHHMYR